MQEQYKAQLNKQISKVKKQAIDMYANDNVIQNLGLTVTFDELKINRLTNKTDNYIRNMLILHGFVDVNINKALKLVTARLNLHTIRIGGSDPIIKRDHTKQLVDYIKGEGIGL